MDYKQQIKKTTPEEFERKIKKDKTWAKIAFIAVLISFLNLGLGFSIKSSDLFRFISALFVILFLCLMSFFHKRIEELLRQTKHELDISAQIASDNDD